MKRINILLIIIISSLYQVYAREEIFIGISEKVLNIASKINFIDILKRTNRTEIDLPNSDEDYFSVFKLLIKDILQKGEINLIKESSRNGLKINNFRIYIKFYFKLPLGIVKKINILVETDIQLLFNLDNKDSILNKLILTIHDYIGDMSNQVALKLIGFSKDTLSSLLNKIFDKYIKRIVNNLVKENTKDLIVNKLTKDESFGFQYSNALILNNSSNKKYILASFNYALTSTNPEFENMYQLVKGDPFDISSIPILERDLNIIISGNVIFDIFRAIITNHVVIKNMDIYIDDLFLKLSDDGNAKISTYIRIKNRGFPIFSERVILNILFYQNENDELRIKVDIEKHGKFIISVAEVFGALTLLNGYINTKLDLPLVKVQPYIKEYISHNVCLKSMLIKPLNGLLLLGIDLNYECSK